MPNLEQLALARLRQTGLPEFAGSTIPEKLANGREAARASLTKYVPALKVNVLEARDVMSHVNVWVQHHQQDLSEAMQSPETNLPRWLKLNMGNSDRVQQWVIANFTVAAAGMGPWQSGRVERLVADPTSDVSETWAAADARARLDSFAMIVKMDNDGDLEYIFRGTGPAAVSGLGALPAVAVWAIAVVVVALAAVVATYFYLSKRLELNNALMAEQCRKAQAEGDKVTVHKCIEATRDIQIDTPLKGLTSELGKVAIILGIAYLGFRYALPTLLEEGGKLLERGERKESRA